jgi:hypothetical protein
MLYRLTILHINTISDAESKGNLFGKENCKVTNFREGETPAESGGS